MDEKEKVGIDINSKLATEVLRSATIVSVICAELVRGEGTEKDMVRGVYAFYLPDGTFIGEIDPVTKLMDLSIEVPSQPPFPTKLNDIKPW